MSVYEHSVQIDFFCSMGRFKTVLLRLQTKRKVSRPPKFSSHFVTFFVLFAFLMEKTPEATTQANSYHLNVLIDFSNKVVVF